MRKLLICLLAIIGSITTVEAQTVVVQNNQGKTEQVQDPNIFYINGIPSTQDIGGVEAQTKYMDGNKYAIFTNYQSTTVTVLYQLLGTYRDNEYEVIGSVVLKSGETKKVLYDYYGHVTKIATITRKL